LILFNIIDNAAFDVFDQGVDDLNFKASNHQLVPKLLSVVLSEPFSKASGITTASSNRSGASRSVNDAGLNAVVVGDPFSDTSQSHPSIFCLRR
jgi:hypothetical protein